ncbi:MAG: hypothetical protein ACI835_001697 [Planctomycetota bacterium]|jgi:hypothetical protein
MKFELDLVEQEALIFVDGVEEERTSPQQALQWSEQREAQWEERDLRFEGGVLLSFDREYKALNGFDLRAATLRGRKREARTVFGSRLIDMPLWIQRESAADAWTLHKYIAEQQSDPASNQGGTAGEGYVRDTAFNQDTAALIAQLDRPLSLRLGDHLRMAHAADEYQIPIAFVAAMLWPGGAAAFAPASAEAAEVKPGALVLTADDERWLEFVRTATGEAVLGPGRPAQVREQTAGLALELVYPLRVTLDANWGEQKELETKNGGLGGASKVFEVHLELTGSVQVRDTDPVRLVLELAGPMSVDREEVRTLQGDVQEFESVRAHSFAGEFSYLLESQVKVAKPEGEQGDR